MWSRSHVSCVKCHETARPHFGKGLCRRCYLEQYNADHLDRVRAMRRRWHEQNIMGTNRGALLRDRIHFDGQREKVLKRDGYKCVRCGSTEKLVVHHKDRTGRRKPVHNNVIKNLETLCRRCHVNEHRSELESAKAIPVMCRNGHPRTAAHGYVNSLGWWRCRTCENIRAKMYRDRK